MEKIGDRLKQLIAARTDDRLRYVQLESTTGISADLWKNFWFGRKKADAEMIEAASKAWPENAYWLTTGATDVEFGHIAPVPDATFPEMHPRQSLPASTEYFRASIRAREAALACIEALKNSKDRDEPPNLKSVPRVAIASWDLAKEIPQLANELRERMYELNDRRNARKTEVGLPSELIAIVRTIEYDYDEAKVISQINEYKQRKHDQLKQQLI